MVAFHLKEKKQHMKFAIDFENLEWVCKIVFWWSLELNEENEGHVIQNCDEKFMPQIGEDRRLSIDNEG